MDENNNHVLVPTLDFDAINMVPKVVEPSIQLITVDNFLSSEACDYLIALSSDHYAPSRVGANGHNVVVDFTKRNSATCFLTRDCAHDPTVVETNALLTMLYGHSELNSDHLQIHKYGKQQFFGPHHDFLEVDTQAERIAATGQRTWTMIVFLNDDFIGGETEFPELFLKIAPRRGMLVAWNNLKHDGTGNPLTLHRGNHVQSGTKYLLSKWFRDLPIELVQIQNQ